MATIVPSLPLFEIATQVGLPHQPQDIDNDTFQLICLYCIFIVHLMYFPLPQVYLYGPKGISY